MPGPPVPRTGLFQGLGADGTDCRKLLQDTIYAKAVKLFGCVEPVARVGRKKSRWEVRLGEVREEIRQVVRQMKRAAEHEKYSYEGLLEEQKQERNQLWRAENGRKRREERSRVRKAFYQDPF